MKDRTQLAAGDDVAQCAHRWPEAPVVADGEDDAGLAAGIEHARRVGAAQGERLFAKHLFACSSAGDDLRRMQRVRGRQQDGIDRGVGEYGVQIIGEL